MTSIQSQFSPTLVRPPKRTPGLPDEGLIPGQTPAAGAGSVSLPAPPFQNPAVGNLPFGNGIQPPVGDPQLPFQADDLGGLEGTQISPEGPTTFDAGPDIVGSPNGGSSILGSATGGAPILGSPNGGAPILGGGVGAPIVGSPNGGAAVLPGDDPRLAGARSRLDASVGDLASTDRRSMLSSLLSDFDTQSAERDDNAMTQVGRRDAALGRLGSGMTSGALGSIARQSNRDKQQFRNQLAQDTIGAEIGDRFSKTSMFRGLAGDEYGYGASDRSERRGERGYSDSRSDRYLDDLRGERGYADNRGDQYRSEARGERGYSDNRGDQYRDEARGERGYQDDFGRTYRNEARGERGYSDNRGDQFRDESRGERQWKYGVGRDNYNNAQDYRNELRGERGYQNERESYGTDRRIQERKLQEDLTDSAFQRAQSRYTIGKTGSPFSGSNYAGAAGDAQGQSDATMQAIMMYLQSLGQGSR